MLCYAILYYINYIITIIYSTIGYSAILYCIILYHAILYYVHYIIIIMILNISINIWMSAQVQVYYIAAKSLVASEMATGIHRGHD